DHPCAVLISGRLHNEMIVKVRQSIVFSRRWMVSGRVVSHHDHLHTLQTHHAVGLGPPTVVAYAHPHHAAKSSSDRPTKVSGFEVPFLEMLKGTLRFILAVPREVYFPIFKNNRACLIDKNRGVVVMYCAVDFR